MISRDWQCLSCRKQFHSFERANPYCAHCGSAKVAWIPGGGHIGKVAPAADATLRSLAADYGMTNIASPSPSRNNRSMPKFEQRRPDMPVKHFAPGFSAPVASAGATCQVSEASVDLRGKVTTGRVLPHSRTVPGPQAMTEFAGRTTGAP
jgi:hypothetical protein